MDNEYKKIIYYLEEYKITKEIEEFKRLLKIRLINPEYSKMELKEFIEMYKEKEKSYEASNNRYSIKCGNSK